MRLAFELSGEHPTLPPSEAMAVVRAYGMKMRDIILRSGLLLVEVGEGEREGEH